MTILNNPAAMARVETLVGEMSDNAVDLGLALPGPDDITSLLLMHIAILTARVEMLEGLLHTERNA